MLIRTSHPSESRQSCFWHCLKYHAWYIILIYFLCNFFICLSNANAATIEAVSCSLSDVQAAINSSSNGDTVIVPAGSCGWNSVAHVSVGITLKGKGIDKTIITNGRTGSGEAALNITGSEGNSFRVTGFTFKGSSYTNNESYCITINGTCKSFRIDHCKFTGGGSNSIYVSGNTYGVIDHCTFVDASNEVIIVFDKVDGSDSWADDIDDILGTENAVFVEDCTFKATGDHSGMHNHAIASNCGGRYVFRHNEVSSLWSLNCVHIDVHGYCFQSNRGGRHYEVYNNTIEIEGSDTNYMAMNIRGGDGVIFNNTFIGNWWYAHIHLQNYRSFQNCSATNPTNCYDGEGYPCKDQIRKLYIWGNTANGGPIKVTVRDEGSNKDHIQQDRDFFLTQKPGYTPFPYPHPLAATALPNAELTGGGSSSCMIDALAADYIGGSAGRTFGSRDAKRRRTQQETGNQIRNPAD